MRMVLMAVVVTKKHHEEEGSVTGRAESNVTFGWPAANF